MAEDKAVYNGTGKRKTSVARVRLMPGQGTVTCNGRTLEDYFPRSSDRMLALSPLVARRASTSTSTSRPRCTAAVSPARPARCATASPARSARPIRPPRELKKAGFLTRDAREVERKKAGLKKAPTPPAVLEALSRSGVAAAASSAPTAFAASRTPTCARSRALARPRRGAARDSSAASDRPRVVVGRDTRRSGPMLEDALCAGIDSAGGVALRAGVLPTPGVAWLVRDARAASAP